LKLLDIAGEKVPFSVDLVINTLYFTKMYKSLAGKLKYSLAVFFLFIFIVEGNAGKSCSGDLYIQAGSDTVKVAAKDSLKVQTKDSVRAAVPDSVVYQKRNLKAEELIRGERLFYGLAYIKSESVNCASCHNTVVSDTLNWNPDAMEISTKYLDKSARDLSKVLLKPTGIKMAQVHKNFHLIPEDVVLIKGYMDKFTEIGLKQDKPVITNLVLFIIAVVVLLFSLTDLLFLKKLNKKWIHVILILLTGGFITNSLVVNALAIGRSHNYMPVQPVKFSHAVHAGQNGTACLYCHSSATVSKTAGIPSQNVCMNCHLMVRNGTRSGAFEIAKVVSSYENNKPIEWVKVHNLPDHVFFSHAQHVAAGGLDCSECHGDVKKMNVISQVSDLSMGWCLDCHRTKKMDVRNKQYYTQYRELAEKMKNGQLDSITEVMVGGRECMKCHY